MIDRAMDAAAYHARPELSSTEARLILDTPATYRWAKDHPPLIQPSKKFDLGTAVHTRVLGVGDPVAVIPEGILAKNGAASTDKAKAFIAKARDDGLVPLKQHEYDDVVTIAEAVLKVKTARALLEQPGTSEASVFATDPVTGVECRARFDFLPEISSRRLVAVDLKTTADASKAAFEKSVATWEYAIQAAWYLDCLTWEHGPLLHGMEPAFMFIAVQKTPPFLTGVYQVPEVWMDRARQSAAEARRLFAECTASGVWPGLPDEVVVLDEPMWHVFQHEARFDGEIQVA